ncbi:hypothetical protein [Clostridium thermosuccinogenes]|jgi:hypothetical protein|uniref:hypothetical protein n=1 Tax=Clostridium thermosuccinogenes TaxID=84032 RepID=UPI001374FE10|nr:hypothetical protein [Pseudoclostridium thermosuccinogenes]
MDLSYAGSSSLAAACVLILINTSDIMNFHKHTVKIVSSEFGVDTLRFAAGKFYVKT